MMELPPAKSFEDYCQITMNYYPDYDSDYDGVLTLEPGIAD